MNYLAHLLLAEATEDGLLGSLYGDFVKGRPDPTLAPGIRRGIVLHRSIDTYTDAHPMHRRSRARFHGTRRRFAGVIVDLCYDHFLCRHWGRFSNEPLASFTARVYTLLATRHAELPPRLARIAPHMAAQDWLGSYADLHAVGRALDGIATRRPRLAPLRGSLEDIRHRYPALHEDFDIFFRDLQRYASQRRGELIEAAHDPTAARATCNDG
ncbi:MAG: DUF479 domain-containing protein [Gammaproteobacteria bacterium]|nr:DUF479 domain-containing protein [Gammaproteobacteria bacterium]